MMARSMKCSNQRPDTLMQDRISHVDEKLLQRTAGPYIGVKSSHKPLMRATTLPPERSETGPKFNPLVHLREPPRCATALSKKTGTLTNPGTG